MQPTTYGLETCLAACILVVVQETPNKIAQKERIADYD
jgi:hypothetical protein